MERQEILVWGANQYGQLGLGFESEQELTPTSLENFTNEEIEDFVGGGGHSFLKTKQGSLFGCGWNNKGQLGFPSDGKNVLSFSRIQFEDVSEIACGWDFTLISDTSGNLYGSGSNAFKQLGNVNSKEVRSFTKLKLEAKVKKISCGMRHSVVLTQNGDVYTAGDNKKGQCGISEDVPSVNKSLVVPSVKEFTKVELPFGVKDISVGQAFTIVLTQNGQLFGFGSNQYGQIDPKCETKKIFRPSLISLIEEEVESVQCGWTHSYALTKNGNLWAWGRNNYGQLGSSDAFEKGPKLVLENVKTFASGYEHGLAVTNEESLYSWGWNEHGNCGNGSQTNVGTPSEILKNLKRFELLSAASAHNLVVIRGE